MKDSVDILREVIINLKELEQSEVALITLAEYFDKFEEPEGIKEILNVHAKDRMPEVEEKCLELLQKHDAEFVKEWKEKKEDTNTESEES